MNHSDAEAMIAAVFCPITATAIHALSHDSTAQEELRERLAQAAESELRKRAKELERWGPECVADRMGPGLDHSDLVLMEAIRGEASDRFRARALCLLSAVHSHRKEDILRAIRSSVSGDLSKLGFNILCARWGAEKVDEELLVKALSDNPHNVGFGVYAVRAAGGCSPTVIPGLLHSLKCRDNSRLCRLEAIDALIHILCDFELDPDEQTVNGLGVVAMVDAPSEVGLACARALEATNCCPQSVGALQSLLIGCKHSELARVCLDGLRAIDDPPVATIAEFARANQVPESSAMALDTLIGILLDTADPGFTDVAGAAAGPKAADAIVAGPTEWPDDAQQQIDHAEATGAATQEQAQRARTELVRALRDRE